MNLWTSHLVLGSTGLALTVLATALLLRLWRGLPIASYRLAVAVLAVALALPLAQLAARSVGLPGGHPVRALVNALRAEPPPHPAARTAPSADAHATVQAQTLAAPSRTLRIDPALLALALLGQEAEEQVPAAAPPRGEVAAAQEQAGGVPWKTLFVLVYLTGLGLALARTARRLLRTRSLLRSAQPVRDERVRAVWRQVAGKSPLARRVRLLASDEVRAPACFGLGRLAVVLPVDESLARRRDVLACVLTHELVHLERRDGWVLLGEELLRAVFWFHPAAWWLVARLERLREVSCDLLVVRRTGQRKRYAQALVEYAAWMTAGERVLGGRAGQAAAVVPWSGSKGQLTRRIEMLLSNQAPTGGRARYVVPAAAGLVFTFLWSGQLALASGAPQDKPHEEHVHEAHAGEHEVTTTIEAQGGVVVTTQGADGQKATLHTKQLELKPGRQIMVVRDGKTVELVDALVQGSDAPIGIVVGEADDTLAAHLGQDKQRVVVVRSVVPGSRASKAGLQEHDVIVSVNGKAGSKRELIEYAKQALRGGHDVQVVVVRKGDRKPLVLRAGEGKAAAAWVQQGGGEGGEEQVFDLALPRKKELRFQVEADEDGNYRVFGLGADDEQDEWEEHEVQVRIEELYDDTIGLGGGSGGSLGKPKTKQKQWTWTDEGGGLHVETTVEIGPDEDESEAYYFELEEDAGETPLEGHKTLRFRGSAQDGGVHLEGDDHVQVFGLGAGGAVVGHKEDGQQLIELQVQENEDGERVIELQLDDGTFGKLLRNEAQDYYRQVDPEDFQKEIQNALKAYESSRKDFTAQDNANMRKLQLYAQKDAQEALEQARKALEGLSDRELGERTKRALEQSDLLLKEKGQYKVYTDGGLHELAEKANVSGERVKIEALKSELDATRKQLDLQRKQIEELKRTLEKLARDRNRELR